MPHELATFDYSQLESPDFKEDSVREVVGILEGIAERAGEDSWRLKRGPQIELFAK
jgi:hypothetical protein